MESAAVLRSFGGALQSAPRAHFYLEKPAVVLISGVASGKHVSRKTPGEGLRLVSSAMPRQRPSYVEATKATAPITSDADTSGTSEGLLQKNAQKSTFPTGFETLVLEVCDETDVAELKLKVGDFEMHLKRDIGSPKSSTPITIPTASPAPPPPVPSKPVAESGSAAPPAVPQKPTPAFSSPFARVSSSKASKLATLEASGSNAYVLIASPTVGSFRRGRTLKGKKQPPSCKEGDMIKEGQIIGFLDQFGSELPIRSDVAGEVLKLLYNDGEAVGYGDPLVAVLPSFHGIK